MDLLQSIPYINVNVLGDNKIENRTVVSYYEITRRMTVLRRELKKEGYVYLNGKIKKVS
jgi:hypothetical protein